MLSKHNANSPMFLTFRPNYIPRNHLREAFFCRFVRKDRRKGFAAVFRYMRMWGNST